MESLSSFNKIDIAAVSERWYQIYRNANIFTRTIVAPSISIRMWNDSETLEPFPDLLEMWNHPFDARLSVLSPRGNTRLLFE